MKAAEKINVFIIKGRVDSISFPSKIKCIYKPVYSLPIVGALNGENVLLNFNQRINADICFTAPNA